MLWYTILLAPLLFYLLLCLIIWRNSPYPERLAFTVVDKETFFARQSDEFKDYHEQLCALGFTLQSQWHTTWGNNLENDLALYLHPDETVIADLTVIRNHTLKTIQEYGELNEYYCDGSTLTVCNANINYSFPPDRAQQQIQLLFPDSSFVELRNIQRELRHGLKYGVAAVPMHDADPVATIHAYMKRECQRLIRLGWYKADSDAEGWHPLTFWGALNITWRSLPVLKDLLYQSQCRYAQRLLMHAKKRRAS